jgi:hypothetical protein
MTWLPWYRRRKARSQQSRAEAQAHLERLRQQQPEVDSLVADLRARWAQNNFRRAVEHAFRTGT